MNTTVAIAALLVVSIAVFVLLRRFNRPVIANPSPPLENDAWHHRRQNSLARPARSPSRPTDQPAG